MPSWKKGDPILIDAWKPKILNHRSIQTYKKNIVSFIETSNVEKITGFTDIEVAVISYLENSKLNMDFSLEKHIEKIQVAVQYFGWMIGVENAYAKLKKNLSLPSKYTDEALKKLSDEYLPEYKRAHPEYVQNQKAQQQRPSIKQKKRDFASINQKWDPKQTKLSEEKRKQSTGCSFTQNHLVPHLPEIKLPNEIVKCNCQKSNFPSSSIDFIRLLDWHHIRDKEHFPEQKYDEKNGHVLCKGHHLWITAISQPERTALLKASIKNHFTQKIKICSDADAEILDKMLDAIVDSVDVWIANHTDKNLEKTHDAVFSFNSFIFSRCQSYDPHRAD